MRNSIQYSILLLSLLVLSACSIDVAMVVAESRNISPNLSNYKKNDLDLLANDQYYDVIQVVLKNKDSRPLSGVVSPAQIFGEGNSDIKCGVSDAQGTATCSVKSNFPGPKLISLYSLSADLPMTQFKDPYSEVSLDKTSAKANGGEVITATIVFKTLNTPLNAGQVPKIKEADSDLIFDCSKSDSRGIAVCRFRSKVAKTYTISWENPVIDSSHSVSFTGSSIKVMDGHLSTAPGSQATISVVAPVGQTPVIDIVPAAGTTYSCSVADASGLSICNISSTSPGIKTVQVTSPGYSDTIQIVVYPATSSTATVTNGTTNNAISVKVLDNHGNPVSGFVPSVSIEGKGNNQILCKTTDDSGVSVCEVYSDTEGAKEIFLQDPFVENPFSFNYVKQFISLVKSSASADGKSAILVELAYVDENGQPLANHTVNPLHDEDVAHYCTTTDSLGIAKCYFTSNSSGVFPTSVKDGSGQTQTFDIVFLSDKTKLNILVGSAKADGTDKVQIQVINFGELLPNVGVVPVLEIDADISVSVHCSAANAFGVSTCDLTSHRSGVVNVRASTPNIATPVQVEFYNVGTSVETTIPGSDSAFADASGSYATLKFTLVDDNGQPIIGVIPHIKYTGPGHLTWTCSPSDSSGVSVCQFSADVVGDYQITLVYPMANVSATLHFLNTTQACTVPFGDGTKQWRGPGFTDFDPCINIQCHSGWYLDTDKNCREDNPPKNGSFVINGGLPLANSQDVVLGIICATDASGVVYVSASEDPDTESWDVCASSKNFHLSSGDGSKTVYMKFKDTFGNKSNAISQTVTLDTVAPSGGSCSVLNTVNNSVTNKNISLQVDCPTDAHGPIMMSIATTPNPNSGYVQCKTPYNYALPDADASYNIYIRFKDAANNVTSADTTTSVILDRQPPTVSANYTNGWITNLTAPVDIVATDAVGTVTNCYAQVAEATLSNGVVGSFGSFADLPLADDGCGSQSHAWVQGKAYSVRVRAKDQAFNFSEWITSSNVLKVDTTPSTGGSILASNTNGSSTVLLTVDSGTDAESGLSTVATDYSIYFKMATLSGGVCGSYGDWEATAISMNPGATSYSYEAAASGCYYFKFEVRNQAGLVTEYTSPSPVQVDVSGPVGGSIVVSSERASTLSLGLTFDPGTDPESGLSTNDADYSLVVAMAPLVNGACGSFGSYSSSEITMTAGTTSAAYVASESGHCYKFKYTVKNALGVVTHYETVSWVDTTASGGGSVLASNTNGTTAIHLVADKGSDSESGMSNLISEYSILVSHSPYVGRNCTGFGAYTESGISMDLTASEYDYTAPETGCYKFKYQVHNQTGILTEYETNEAVVVDKTVPTGGFISSSPQATSQSLLTLTFDPGDDADSGLSSSDTDYGIEVATGVADHGSCIDLGDYVSAGLSVTVALRNATYASVTPGQCYKFRYSVKNNFGHTAMYESAPSFIDVDAPTMGFVSMDNVAPACEHVRFTVNGAGDGTSGLANAAYSFDGGVTWQMESYLDVPGITVTKTAGQILVRDRAGNSVANMSDVTETSLPCQKNPSNLSLSHTANNKTFTVSWNAGVGNGGVGGCKLQYYKNGSAWTDLAGTYNCDTNVSSASVTLPADGWTNNFTSGVDIRLVRGSDSVNMGSFAQKLTCASKSAPTSPTPSVDEDCDGNWDNVTTTHVSDGYWNSYTYSCITGQTCSQYICGTHCEERGYFVTDYDGNGNAIGSHQETYTDCNITDYCQSCTDNWGTCSGSSWVDTSYNIYYYH